MLDGTASNKITGAGTVTLDGDFTIDTTLADITNGNTWTLVDVANPARNVRLHLHHRSVSPKQA